MRRWLVGTSLVLHLAILFGVFVAGVWRIDQLEPGRHNIDLAVAVPPPPAREGGPAAKPAAFVPKHARAVVHEITQPQIREPDVKPAEVSDATDRNGKGHDIGDGSGTSHDGPDGPCVGECGPATGSATPTVVEQKPTVPQMIAPGVLRGLRTAGNTQIDASDLVKTTMMRDGHDHVSAVFKLCLDTSGAVDSLHQLHSTGYAEYDAALAAAIHDWRYQPYTVNGLAIPVCGVVTFNYSVK